MSPLGISWGYLALLLVPALVIVAALFVVVRRREIRSPRVWFLVASAVTAGMWTFFTIGAPVMVSIPQDPQGSECLVDAFGDKSGKDCELDQ
jgi:hypothetical protein